MGDTSISISSVDENDKANSNGHGNEKEALSGKRTHDDRPTKFTRCRTGCLRCRTRRRKCRVFFTATPVDEDCG